jgi:hypothetical protein
MDLVLYFRSKYQIESLVLVAPIPLYSGVNTSYLCNANLWNITKIWFKDHYEPEKNLLVEMALLEKELQMFSAGSSQSKSQHASLD